MLMSLDGRGSVKATTGAVSLIDHFRPQYLLLAGIAGGIQGRDGTSVGDVIVPNFIDYYEMRKLVPGKSLRRSEPYDHPSFALLSYRSRPIARTGAWLSGVTMARPVNDGLLPKVLHGMLISGEKVLSDDAATYQRQILQEYDNALGVDMKSFGVASAIYSSRLTRHYNPQYLVIRGVSDVLRPLPVGADQQELHQDGVSNNEMRAFPAQDNVDMLFARLDNDKYEWVRYGALRSLMEIAARSLDLRDRVFRALGDRLGILESHGRLSGEFSRAAFAKELEDREGWMRAIGQIIRRLADRTVSKGEFERWVRLSGDLEAFHRLRGARA